MSRLWSSRGSSGRALPAGRNAQPELGVRALGAGGTKGTRPPRRVLLCFTGPWKVGVGARCWLMLCVFQGQRGLRWPRCQGQSWSRGRCSSTDTCCAAAGSCPPRASRSTTNTRSGRWEHVYWPWDGGVVPITGGPSQGWAPGTGSRGQGWSFEGW